MDLSRETVHGASSTCPDAQRYSDRILDLGSFRLGYRGFSRVNSLDSPISAILSDRAGVLDWFGPANSNARFDSGYGWFRTEFLCSWRRQSYPVGRALLSHVCRSLALCHACISDPDSMSGGTPKVVQRLDPYKETPIQIESLRWTAALRVFRLSSNALFPPARPRRLSGDTSDTPRRLGAIESLDEYIGPRAPGGNRKVSCTSRETNQRCG